MHEVLDDVCESLDALSSLILKSWTDDRTLAEVYGWHHPAITRHDISAKPAELASKIRLANVNEVDAKLSARLQDAPRRLQLLHPTTVPHLFNGNAHQALQALTETLNWLSDLLDPIFGWQTLQDNKAMPAPMARRLRGIQADIDELVPNKDRLQEQIRQIQDATDAAESLPTDMQSLKEARNTINRLSEPPRILRRLQLLRGWSHEEVSEVFARGTRARRAHGVRAPR
ncbi:hypothetical protein LJR039_005288 [Pseudorhodoferax sp. LjRoot39]|uniref:hypothetical protein n=1 Tax=Pseudorhodoferax sp. LjRoot39 TaxID=3342328 RepID=UPI003ECE4292